MTTQKIAWRGRVLSVQPRIRLRRSFDQRSHSYLGFVLQVELSDPKDKDSVLVAIGKAAQAKHLFRAGYRARGVSVPVADPEREPAELYKTSALQVLAREEDTASPPPYVGVAPALETYRARRHRRLAAKTYEKSGTRCIWGARMPVEMIIDPWNPSRKKHRFETFCYGPKSCSS